MINRIAAEFSCDKSLQHRTQKALESIANLLQSDIDELSTDNDRVLDLSDILVELKRAVNEATDESVTHEAILQEINQIFTNDLGYNALN